MPRFPASLFLAAALLASPSAAQIFEQGPVEIREFRNPNLAPPLAAHGIETENMFGFTLGSDTDEAGSFGVALESVTRFSRRAGAYTAMGSKLEFAYGLTDNLSVSASLLAGYRAISNADDFANTRRFRFDGIGGEIRWRILPRGPSPVGVTLHLEPAFRLADEVSGEGGRGFASENKLILDTALVPDQVFAALNVIYDFEAFRPRGSPSERASAFGVSGALAVQVAPQLFLGGELRYLRAYEGLGLNRYQGHGLFVGPTLFWHFSDAGWMSLAFNTQLAGRANNVPRSLDLENFTRHGLRFKIGMHF
jgi:hypothetical protein